jgi:hypothetical protein
VSPHTLEGQLANASPAPVPTSLSPLGKPGFRRQSGEATRKPASRASKTGAVYQSASCCAACSAAIAPSVVLLGGPVQGTVRRRGGRAGGAVYPGNVTRAAAVPALLRPECAGGSCCRHWSRTYCSCYRDILCTFHTLDVVPTCLSVSSWRSFFFFWGNRRSRSSYWK